MEFIAGQPLHGRTKPTGKGPTQSKLVDVTRTPPPCLLLSMRPDQLEYRIRVVGENPTSAQQNDTKADRLGV